VVSFGEGSQLGAFKMEAPTVFSAKLLKHGFGIETRMINIL
jgi:hypothetical protein